MDSNEVLLRRACSDLPDAEGLGTESSPRARSLPLRMVSALVHALGHQVRTPLSVISNDLHFLRSKLPEGECDRALRRCREIGALFSLQNIPEKLPAELAEVELQTIFPELPSAARVFADRQCLGALRELVVSLCAFLCNEQTPLRAEFFDGIEKLTIHLPLLLPELEASADSCTEFFFETAKFDALQPILIDAYMLAMGGKASVECDASGCRLNFTFSRGAE